MFDWYQHIPSHIDPVAIAIGSFSVRWYGLSYLTGLIVVLGLLLWRIKKGESDHLLAENKNFGNQALKKKLADVTFDLILVVFFAALIGGRLGYVIFYNPAFFFAHPLAIVSPYDSASGLLIGIYGMSYHGALLGALFGGWAYAKRRKLDFLRWADFLVSALPLGYFFGRIGNFLNGELYGRATYSPLGMYFVNDPKVLRHPSQLYEAVLEGLVIFCVLWLLRNGTQKPGLLLNLYIILYACARIIAEQWRQPDPQLGFLMFGLTMGQLLSILMFLVGAIFFFKVRKK
ncbi:MAG TPA: prolipoprotein diacylglyceryl transferase [Patescibacteria group bacterium]